MSDRPQEMSEDEFTKLIEAAAQSAWSETLEEFKRIGNTPANMALFIAGFAAGAEWAVDFSKKVRIYQGKPER